MTSLHNITEDNETINDITDEDDTMDNIIEEKETIDNIKEEDNLCYYCSTMFDTWSITWRTTIYMDIFNQYKYPLISLLLGQWFVSIWTWLVYVNEYLQLVHISADFNNKRM